MIKLNQRVMTPLGPATVLGFETFLEDGNQGPDVTDDPGGNARVIVRLDEPKNWIASPRTPHPYMFRRQITELKEDA